MFQIYIKRNMERDINRNMERYIKRDMERGRERDHIRKKSVQCVRWPLPLNLSLLFIYWEPWLTPPGFTLPLEYRERQGECSSSPGTPRLSLVCPGLCHTSTGLEFGYFIGTQYLISGNLRQNSNITLYTSHCCYSEMK